MSRFPFAAATVMQDNTHVPQSRARDAPVIYSPMEIQSRQLIRGWRSVPRSLSVFISCCFFPNESILVFLRRPVFRGGEESKGPLETPTLSFRAGPPLKFGRRPRHRRGNAAPTHTKKKRGSERRQEGACSCRMHLLVPPPPPTPPPRKDAEHSSFTGGGGVGGGSST